MNGSYKLKKGNPVYMILLSCIIVVLIVVNFVCVYHMDFNIRFENVATYDVTIKPSSGKMGAFWIGLRDSNYGGFFPNDILEYNFGIDYTEFDFNKYTYIITFGYELKKISYSYDTMKNRRLVFIPKQFVGKVVLLDDYKEKIYIYKIKKMDIDCDFHERSREVYFVREDLEITL